MFFFFFHVLLLTFNVCSRKGPPASGVLRLPVAEHALHFVARFCGIWQKKKNTSTRDFRMFIVSARSLVVLLKLTLAESAPVLFARSVTSGQCEYHCLYP